MHITYILHSDSINKFYTGSTSGSVDDRLAKHNFKHKGFTSLASDWIVVFSQQFSTITEARQFENKIKKRGASRFLEDLKIS